MSDKKSQENGQESTAGQGAPEMSGATARWMQDLGSAAESLAHMMRKPTDNRPFVYEVRFDLLPAKASQAMAVMKGFGDDKPQVLFSNGNDFLTILRNLEGQMRSGKSRWFDDSYPPNNYEDRLKRYREGGFYRKP